ncbi:MAG: chorismate synthase [Leptospiraceae bacterium]|nr:chorismate synthase [Leptospiraceae bacterium]MCP5512804.1 chorismate synthase [Leptospiraceae bacterium]
MPSTWGKIFKITTFGESHGTSVGVVIEGLPGGMPFSLEEIQKDLSRRRPGQNLLTTPRKEDDEVRVVSGVFEGKTIGSPVCLFVDNKNAIGRDYEKFRHIYRPSHADFTYDAKYGFRSHVGGGRASVRETIGRVAAGAIARVILERELGISTIAWVDSIGTVNADLESNPPKSFEEVDSNDVRCPDPKAAPLMEEKIREVRKIGDSIGGTIRAVVRNCPPGLGDPVYDKLDGDLGRAVLSIPACKGFEIGSGFEGTKYRGSEHNDEFYVEEGTGRIRTKTNRSGGLQGGISNGENITIRAAFKPTATISIEQGTVDDTPENTILKAGGRHDPCVLPRAVPIVEAAINLVLIDAYFYQRSLHPEWWQKHSLK